MQTTDFIQRNTLKIAFEAAKKSDCAVAVWRLPNTENQINDKNIIVDFSAEILPKKFNLEDNLQDNLGENKAGFVVSPFKNKDFEQTYFINADFFYTENITENPLEKTSFKSEKERIFFENLSENLSNSPQKNDKNPPTLTLKPYNSEIFKDLVKKAILAIKKSDFLKVIASRQQEVLFENNNQIDTFDVMQAFDNLCKNYPNAFISLFFIPNVGSWMGASPEVLVSINENNIFHTMALAGTQAHIQGESLQSAVWAQKEIEEQALVSRYIINCFKKIRLREFEEEGPKTVEAGNLLHLRTDFWVDMKTVHFPQLASTMLELLHPTSAVCGMPKEPALAFIDENEAQQRAFYCGFLGTINLQNETNIFVNLRCMEIFDNKLVLYAGGGITAYSDPEKEWNETVIKCQTILKGIL